MPGGDPQENADIAHAIFAGEPGAARDLAVFNAGAAIYAGGRADSLAGGVLFAQEAIDTGAAAAKLDAFVELTQSSPPGVRGVNVLMRSWRRRAPGWPPRRGRAAARARAAGGSGEPRPDFNPRLSRGAHAPGLSVIAEHKRSSPSAGVIRAELELADVVGAYERGGAAALSVLTEETRFGGTLADLLAARAAASLPILRKDFIVDEYQVYEAPPAVADAILLIVAALEVGPLGHLHALATSSACQRWWRSTTRRVAGRARDRSADRRDQQPQPGRRCTLTSRRTYRLLPQIPAGVVKVAESGFRTTSSSSGSRCRCRCGADRRGADALT